MLIGKVVKKIISTVKNKAFSGRPLLLVQPLKIDFSPKGAEVLCIDFMGADIGELVLVLKEGSSVNDLLKTRKAPADAAIVAIIDSIDVDKKKLYEKSNA
jgi:ethanolamine utilization protein EutN